jgi:predicted esterase
MRTMANPNDPHAGQPLVTAGPDPREAALTLLLIHGRGAEARGMLAIYQALGLDAVAALAPQAAGNTWYPHSFLEPVESNQPFLDSALARIASIIGELETRGVAAGRIALLGFSQGACLASEFVARHPRRYAAILALSGGLIGPPGTPRNYPGNLDHTPVFLGSADPDPHVPFARVQETEKVLARMGATVEIRRYPGMPHTINDDELDACRKLLQAAISEEDHDIRR